MVGAIAQNPNATPDMARSVAAQAVKLGYVTPEAAEQGLSSMPNDPAEFRQWLQTVNTSILDGQQRFNAMYGVPEWVDTGDKLTPIVNAPLTGPRQTGASIQKETTPAQRAAGVQGTDANGNPVIIPTGEILERAGYNPLTAKPATAPSRQGWNELSGAPMPAQGRPGEAIIGQPAGQVEAQKAAGQISGQQYAEDTARERNFQAEILPLQKAKDALIALGPRGTGPGQEQLQEIQSFLTSMGIIAPTEGLKNFDEARKYLVQYASQAGNTNTNDKLAASFAGNPSVGISDAAAVDVVKTAMTLRRLQNAQVRAFEASGLPEADYNRWAAQFNSTQDPVGFGIDMMDVKDRKKYIDGLDKAGKARLANSLRTATALGLISMPGQ
jgi:hypothetical protein